MPKLDLGPAPVHEQEFSVEVAHSAARLAEKLGARYIVVYTETGYSAQLLSKHRPTCPIFAVSRHDDVCRRAKPLWGVRSKRIELPQHLDQLVLTIDEMMTSLGWAESGDLVVVVAGTPFHTKGRTDLIKLHRLGQE